VKRKTSDRNDVLSVNTRTNLL